MIYCKEGSFSYSSVERIVVIDWFNGLDPNVQAALIAAFVTFLGILLKEGGIYFWKELRSERKDALSIYRNYADPIASAAESLFWRLHETLTLEGRGRFLKSSGKATQFDQYKYESTLYRIAALIGWLRAYRRELTLFSLSSPKKLNRLRISIEKFEKTLSDGTHVEVQKVRSLANLWSLSLPTDPNEISTLGVAVEQVSKPILQSKGVNIASDLDSGERIELCKKVACEMTSRLSVNPLTDNIVQETVNQAIQSLSIREAWLYRDFQAAIGDLMISKVSGGRRRFEVMGFAEFEKLLLSDDPHIIRWMGRLNRMIEGLDISGADRFDARVQMFELTFLSTIELLKSLHHVDPDRGIVSDTLFEKANPLVRDTSWRKSKAADLRED